MSTVLEPSNETTRLDDLKSPLTKYYGSEVMASEPSAGYVNEIDGFLQTNISRFNNSSQINDDNFKAQLGRVESAQSVFPIADAIVNENYLNTINIPSKVILMNDDFIVCECLVDKERLIFEKRDFPRILFTGIRDLKLEGFVLISIKSKPGSIKYNVYKGDEFFDTSLFNRADKANKIWDQINKLNLVDPFEFNME